MVNARNVAERRSINVGAQFDGFVAVTRGLVAGDTVIFRGLKLVKDGVEVKPVQTEMREFDNSSDPTGLSPFPGNAAGDR